MDAVQAMSKTPVATVDVAQKSGSTAEARHGRNASEVFLTLAESMEASSVRAFAENGVSRNARARRMAGARMKHTEKTN